MTMNMKDVPSKTVKREENCPERSFPPWLDSAPTCNEPVAPRLRCLGPVCFGREGVMKACLLLLAASFRIPCFFSKAFQA